MTRHIVVEYWRSGSQYIATSPDLPGFLVEESSEAEMEKSAGEIISIILGRTPPLVFKRFDPNDEAKQMKGPLTALGGLCVFVLGLAVASPLALCFPDHWASTVSSIGIATILAGLMMLFVGIAKSLGNLLRRR